MTEQNIVEFITDWQTGFYFLLAMGAVSLVVGAIAGSILGEIGRFLGVFAGMALGFLLVSYLFYKP